MRIAVRPLLCSAWLIVLVVGWDVAAYAETPARAQAQPVPRLGVTQGEPRELKGVGRPAQPRTGKSEAPHITGKTTPAATASTPHPVSPGNEPLPLPPRPPSAAAPHPAPPPPKAAEKRADAENSEVQPSKLPRFASLRADDVNMRVGPGARYRIEWVYKRRELPVEIIREYDVWRYVRDADGIQGWMQQATLMGRRTFIIRPADATLREEPKETAHAVAVLKIGVIGRIRSCEALSDWCRVQAGSYRGYLRREQFWGTLPHEAINP